MQNRVSNREWGLPAHPGVRVLTGGLAPKVVILVAKTNGDYRSLCCLRGGYNFGDDPRSP